MENVFNILLILHIVGGTSGLFTGTINLIRRKGGRQHVVIGRIFVYSMLIAGFSSLALAVIHPNYFLFVVGVFTVYMVGTGNRYIYLRLLGNAQKPKAADWMLTIGMLAAGIAFGALGIFNLVKGHNFGIVLLVFGFVSIRFVQTDLRNYKGKQKEKNYWLMAHLQRMTGGYIASATAFLVVNSGHLPNIPPVLAWLLPTAVLTPLIVVWSKRYKQSHF